MDAISITHKYPQHCFSREQLLANWSSKQKEIAKWQFFGKSFCYIQRALNCFLRTLKHSSCRLWFLQFTQISYWCAHCKLTHQEGSNNQLVGNHQLGHRLWYWRHHKAARTWTPQVYHSDPATSPSPSLWLSAFHGQTHPRSYFNTEIWILELLSSDDLMPSHICSRRRPSQW
jgi:hypothetical protein